MIQRDFSFHSGFHIRIDLFKFYSDSYLFRFYSESYTNLHMMERVY